MKIKVFIFFLFLFSCDLIAPDDHFQLRLIPNNSDLLRIDGYYYSIYTDDTLDYYKIYFLYENGVVLDGGYHNEYYLSVMEEQFKNGIYYNRKKDQKYDWGIYQIKSDRIDIELYQAENTYWTTCISEGYILNDTTFFIKKAICQSNDEYDLNQTFRFKQFAPKPDSTINQINKTF